MHTTYYPSTAPEPCDLPALIQRQAVAVDEAWRTYFRLDEGYRVALARTTLWLWDKERRGDLKNDAQRNAALDLWKYYGEENAGLDDVPEDAVDLRVLREQAYEAKTAARLAEIELDRLDRLYRLALAAVAEAPITLTTR